MCALVGRKQALSFLYFRATVGVLLRPQEGRCVGCSHEQHTYGKGWSCCDLFPLLSLVCVSLLSASSHHALIYSLSEAYLPADLGHAHVIFYPAAQPDHVVKHQKPPEAERGNGEILTCAFTRENMALVIPGFPFSKLISDF